MKGEEIEVGGGGVACNWCGCGEGEERAGEGQTIGGEGCEREGMKGRGRERGLERAINAMFTCRPPPQFKEKER